MSKCTECKGSGIINWSIVAPPNTITQTYDEPCPACNGTGNKPQDEDRKPEMIYAMSALEGWWCDEIQHDSDIEYIISDKYAELESLLKSKEAEIERLRSRDIKASEKITELCKDGINLSSLLDKAVEALDKSKGFLMAGLIRSDEVTIDDAEEILKDVNEALTEIKEKR